MTKETFEDALSMIDSSYISEALDYDEGKRKTNGNLSFILLGAAVIVCFALMAVSVFLIMKRPLSDVNNPSAEQIQSGFDEVTDDDTQPAGDCEIGMGLGQELSVGSDASEKPTTGHKIGLRYYEFYTEKIIRIDAFMSQVLTAFEKETPDGYPVFEVYRGTKSHDSESNAAVTIIGSGERYEKRFTLDDWYHYLVADFNSNIFDAHRETVTLDFSDMKAGEVVTMTFSYGVFYYSNNPYNCINPDNSWCGKRRSLYFYCGENGLSVSSNSAEDAIESYKKWVGESDTSGDNYVGMDSETNCENDAFSIENNNRKYIIDDCSIFQSIHSTVYCPSNTAFVKNINKYEESECIVNCSSDTPDSIVIIPSFEIKGYIRWTDSSNITHPARNVTVEIYKSDSITSSDQLLNSVSTNDLGYYSAVFPASSSGINIYIRVKSKGLNIDVKQPSGIEYQYSSNIYSDILMGDSVTISYTANNNSYLGKSLCVHQALELANRYMYSLENRYMNNIDVYFPDDTHGTCFVPNTNRIYIMKEDAFDWDVIEHEYGHFIASQFGFLASVGGNHSYDTVLALTNGKSDGIKLAWNEGWATYFSINLQNKMNASSMNIPYVGDTFYTDTDDNDFYINIETVYSNLLLGESGEIAISGILYDITDPTSMSDDDEIYCANSDIWGIIKRSASNDFSSFIQAFYSSNFTTEVKLKLGKSLSHFKVAALLTNVSGLSGTNPTVYWEKQGGDPLYQNGLFQLAFYDSSYNLILRTSVTNGTYQILTPTQWNQIKNNNSLVYCCVEAYQTTEPRTGVYCSNSIALNIP